MNDVESQPLPRGQLRIGLATALVVFGYITIAGLGSGNPIVHSIMIGPYGTSAAFWLLMGCAVVGWLHRREQTGRQP